MTDVCDGHVHEAIKADRAKWKSLPYVGHQFHLGMPVDEVRNCTCKSTLYCACDPNEALLILEVIPHVMDAIHLAVGVIGVIAIADIVSALKGVDIGIVESHTTEAIRRLVAERRVRVDPYYDADGNKIFNRKVYAL